MRGDARIGGAWGALEAYFLVVSMAVIGGGSGVLTSVAHLLGR